MLHGVAFESDRTTNSQSIEPVTQTRYASSRVVEEKNLKDVGFGRKLSSVENTNMGSNSAFSSSSSIVANTNKKTQLPNDRRRSFVKR